MTPPCPLHSLTFLTITPCFVFYQMLPVHPVLSLSIVVFSFSALVFTFTFVSWCCFFIFVYYHFIVHSRICIRRMWIFRNRRNYFFSVSEYLIFYCLRYIRCFVYLICKFAWVCVKDSVLDLIQKQTTEVRAPVPEFLF